MEAAAATGLPGYGHVDLGRVDGVARVERKAGEHILRHAGQEAEEDDVEPCHDLIIVEDCNVWKFDHQGCGNGGVAGRGQDRVTLAFQRALPAYITGEAGHFQAFLHRLGVAFAARAAVDDAVNARSNQVFKLRHKGVSVDAAVSTVGRDGGRLDAFECHEAQRVSTTPGARPSGMVMLSGGRHYRSGRATALNARRRVRRRR